MHLQRLTLLLASGALACGSPFSEGERSNGPPVGAIEVELDVRYGEVDTPDPNGYLVAGPGFTIPTGTYSEVVLTPGMPEGMVATIKIEGVAEWCTVTPTARTTTTRGNDTIPMKFILTCIPLLRPVRFMLRSRGVRPDTSSATLNALHFGVTAVVTPGDTLRRMTLVDNHAMSVTMPPWCRRLPTDQPILVVPHYPSDTINYVINRNCGIIRVLANLGIGSSVTEVAADSAYWVGVANGVPDAWGSRGSYNNQRIARARRRTTGGATEWAVTHTSALTAGETLLRPWSTTFAGYPTWRRDQTRVDFLVQDSSGVTLWSNTIPALGLQQLQVPGTLALGSPEWSPDGTRLAYVTDSGVAIAPLGAVVAEHLFTPTLSLTLTDPRWLPSGTP